MALTSIVVLTYNQLEDCTKSCIESIYKYTKKEDFELIIVDNNSQDGTQEYLKEIEPKYENMSLILNATNKGYSGGNNDGIKVAKGEYVILLNNDTLVSENWLTQILKPFEDKKVGMVGPVSNSVGNEQRINIDRLNEKNYNEKIAQYITDNKDVITITQRLGFFCVAIKAKVIQKIGLLDEQFGIGMFEDDDYCMRATQNGYKLVITDGCFVYHKGSVSFKKLTTEAYQEIFQKNKAYFLEKHGVQWSYSDIILGYFNYCIQSINSQNILTRAEDFKNMILFLKDIESNSDVDVISKKNKELMEISDWATGLKNTVDEQCQFISEKNKELIEISDWARELNNNLQDKDKELIEIKNNFWFRVLKKLKFIKERPNYIRLLEKAQILIRNNTINPNLELYQSQEILYWEYVPKWLSSNLSISKSKNILDIGCGYGTLGIYSKLLSPCSNVVVTDIVKYANTDFLTSLNIDFFIQNIEIDVIENKYDIIILSEVLEHFNFHPVHTLVKIRQQLNKDGILILTTPDAKSWGKIDKYYKKLSDIPEITTFDNTLEFKWIDDHVWQYTKDELLTIIKKSGFIIDKIEYSQGVSNKKHFNLLLRASI